MKQLSEWMAQIAGPEADPRERKATITRMERVKDSRTTAELASLYRENRQQFDSQFRQQALKVKDIANIPAGVPAAASFASFEEFLILLRASRALAMCLSVHGAHPLSLIARATKGDRRAALDLIKIDKMFLHDRCTENLIKKAELQNDHAFLKQLARVQTFLPKVSARGMQRLYFYGLFFMEHGEMPLPSQHELWRILDPHGRQYRSLSAFERDFQRHRKIFDRMVSNIATDILKDAEKENA